MTATESDTSRLAPSAAPAASIAESICWLRVERSRGDQLSANSRAERSS